MLYSTRPQDIKFSSIEGRAESIGDLFIPSDHNCRAILI